MKTNNKFSAAIFAHNISDMISPCVKSILTSSPDKKLPVYVLANGCTDSTAKVVRNLQSEYSNLYYINIPLADKANAWNYYVHRLAPEGALHFFIDGDVEVLPSSLRSITESMNKNSYLNAVGGVPVVGRDRIGWTKRMITSGRVSGGLYALTDDFIQNLRKNEVKLPIGFIGEDFLVSALAKNMLSLQGIYTPSPLLYIDTQSGFYFHQLSPFKIQDYFSYFRRLVRYRLRNYQISMIMKFLNDHRTNRMPLSVEVLYRENKQHLRFYLRGRITIIDWLAILHMRKRLKNAKADR